MALFAQKYQETVRVVRSQITAESFVEELMLLHRQYWDLQIVYEGA